MAEKIRHCKNDIGDNKLIQTDVTDSSRMILRKTFCKLKFHKDSRNLCYIIGDEEIVKSGIVEKERGVRVGAPVSSSARQYIQLETLAVSSKAVMTLLMSQSLST